MGEKGKYWRDVKFTKNGEPIYPEEFEEGELPYEKDAPETLSKVKVSYSRTLNLGDFNSARVEIGVELPCRVNELQEAYEAAVEFVGPKYVETINEVVQSRKAKNDGEAVINKTASDKDYGY